MSGHGEQPGESAGEQQTETRAESVALGEFVYNQEGEQLGRVRGYEKAGFFVTTRQGMEMLSIEHARSGHEFGEAHLMWRCTNCGEMANLDDGLPEECPNCGVEKEQLMYWTED